MKSLVLILFITCVYSSIPSGIPVSSTSYLSTYSIYVNKGGNDVTGDGSIDFPFLTIARGMQVVNDSNTNKRYHLNIGGGRYDEDSSLELKPWVWLIGTQRTATRITVSGNVLRLSENFNVTGNYRLGMQNLVISGSTDVILDLQNFTSSGSTVIELQSVFINNRLIFRGRTTADFIETWTSQLLGDVIFQACSGFLKDSYVASNLYMNDVGNRATLSSHTIYLSNFKGINHNKGRRNIQKFIKNYESLPDGSKFQDSNGFLFTVADTNIDGGVVLNKTLDLVFQAQFKSSLSSALNAFATPSGINPSALLQVDLSSMSRIINIDNNVDFYVLNPGIRLDYETATPLGTTQNTSYPISMYFTIITGGSANSGVILPPITPGEYQSVYVIKNSNGPSPCFIYPFNGNTIDNLGVNTPYSISVSESASLLATSSGWYTF